MAVKKMRVGRAPKAYENLEFVNSDEGRTMRILSEYCQPASVFDRDGISGTLVFFGSARILSNEEFMLQLHDLNDILAGAQEADKPQIQLSIDAHLRRHPMMKIYEDTVEIAERLSKWSLSREKTKRYFVMTGGGPGAMEAANRGAHRAKAPSIGLNISLPFEQYPNQYLSPEYNFDFRYFFMRKYWFIDKAKAFIVIPGGLGTIDEMVEILTLIQTTKVQRNVPIVLYYEEFWKKVINFDYLIEQDMMKKEDLDLFTYCNTPDEVFDYVTTKIIEAEEA